MKKLVYLLSIILLFGCSQPEKVTPKTSKIDKGNFYKSITRLFEQATASINAKDDSLHQINERFLETLVKYKDIIIDLGDTSLNHDSLYTPLRIASSTDRQFSVVSWDTQEGGTMIEYAAMAIFKTNKGVQYKHLVDISAGDTVNALIHFDTVVTISDNNKNIYIARGFGQGSSALKWELLNAFAIVNDHLSEPSLFPEFEDPASPAYTQQFSTTRFSRILGIEFDLHYCNESFYKKRPVITFLDQAQTLKIPVVNDDGGNTNNYYTLKFAGGHFLQSK